MTNTWLSSLVLIFQISSFPDVITSLKRCARVVCTNLNEAQIDFTDENDAQIGKHILN